MLSPVIWFALGGDGDLREFDGGQVDVRPAQNLGATLIILMLLPPSSHHRDTGPARLEVANRRPPVTRVMS